MEYRIREYAILFWVGQLHIKQEIPIFPAETSVNNPLNSDNFKVILYTYFKLDLPGI